MMLDLLQSRLSDHNIPRSDRSASTMADSLSTASPSQASFLGLPPEIRLQIYERVFDKRVSCNLGCNRTVSGAPYYSAILQANKQIFSESISVFYCEHKLCLPFLSYKGGSRLLDAFRQRPSYALPNMRAIAIGETLYWYQKGVSRECLGIRKEDWPWLHDHLPNLVFLQIIIHLGECDSSIVDYEAFENFLGGFKKLQKAKVSITVGTGRGMEGVKVRLLEAIESASRPDVSMQVECEADFDYDNLSLRIQDQIMLDRENM